MTPFSERKILKHVSELSKFVSGEEYPPIQVEIDLTNKCTSDCPWCFGYKDRKWNDFMLLANDSPDPIERFNSSIQGIRNLIQDFKTLGVKAVTWTGGGDPTCHKGLFELLELSHSLGLENGLITNGVIDVKKALPFCKWIRFSVDAATKETYGYMHGKKEHFELVINNIKDLARIKRNSGYDCTLGVGFLTSEKSAHEIIRFANIWKDSSGIDYIQYRPLLDSYGQSWFCKSSNIIKAIELARDNDNRVVDSKAKYKAQALGSCGRTTKCYGIFFETVIAADSLVYTCCHHKGIKKYAIGDLKKESIFKIWKRHLEKRSFFLNKECPSFCRHFGTNYFMEHEVFEQRQHENFI